MRVADAVPRGALDTPDAVGVPRPRPERGTHRERLVVFTRYPQPGRVKTRLIPALGGSGAARLHGQMVDHTLAWADCLAGKRRIDLEVHFTGGTADEMGPRFGTHRRYIPQNGEDLGVRMHRAFVAGFADGMDGVIVIGTDCPGMTAELVGGAFDALGTHDVVIGPARDGGYYLLGMRRPVPELFERMPWGTQRVRPETVRRAAALGLSVHLLQLLDDVDHPSDLAVWDRIRAGGETATAKCLVSVVVPTLNEAKNVAELTDTLGRLENVELVVADGGSADRTVAVARERGAMVVQGATGRACQMNAGAEVARGNVLIFLHADTRLPARGLEAVRRVIRDPQVVGGAFLARLRCSHRGLRLIEHAVNLRTRVFRVPYGDQALFLRRNVFRELGGYPRIPIMEDVELVRRLRQRGKFVVLPLAARTSARRWEANGAIRTTLVNWVTFVRYAFGVRSDALRADYDRLLATHNERF